MPYMSYEDAGKAASTSAQGPSLFLRLVEDRDKALIVLLGEKGRDVYAYEVVWTGTAYEPYDPQKHTTRPTTKFAMNVLHVDGGAQVKVLEVNRPTYQSLRTAMEKYKDAVLELQRHGAKGDSKTTYSVFFERPIDAEIRAAIGRQKLHDLEAVLTSGAGGETQPAGDTSFSYGHNALLDPTLVQTTIARLKALPRAAVDEFLTALGVARVKDLQAAQRGRMEQVLAQLEARHKNANGGGAADPFEA